MDKNTSIITMVGASNYDTTTYKFPNGCQSKKTTIFSNALIEHYRDKLKTVVFLGTETSSWSSILPDSKNEEECNFLEMLQSKERQNPRLPIVTEDFKKIETILKKFYPELEIYVLPLKSDISLESRPLDVYSEIINYVKDSKIVLDITSAFRYVPLFIFESLQTYSPNFDANDITLLYAEKNERADVDYQVRDISEVWRAAEINKALYSFQMTLDGSKLARYLERAGETKLAEWVSTFSDYIQKSYIALCDYSFLKRLDNIVASKDIESIQVSFVKETYVFLRDKILSNFSYLKEISDINRRSCCLYTFASLLNAKKLYSQAFIALRESVVMRIIENYKPELLKQKRINPDDLDDIGLYKYLNDHLEAYDKKVKEKWIVLKNTRNLSAHAGIELIYNMKNIEQSKEFDKYQEAVKEILEVVIKCK